MRRDWIGARELGQSIDSINHLDRRKIQHALLFAQNILRALCFRPRPSMQFQPSHQAEDMGVRLVVPSGFTLLSNTTGVPKYRMEGSTLLCIPKA